MIEYRAPATWRELQSNVAKILRECGVRSMVERTVETARGQVEIDVWAYDDSATPPQTYLIECKYWKRSVPKTVAHAFRSIVGDSGAEWGAIVSSSGYQRGAIEAAKYSNVRLLTWDQFQELFVLRWYERYFLPTVSQGVAALSEYIEPLNSRVFRKADALPKDKQDQFASLRNRYANFEYFCLNLRAGTSFHLASGPDCTRILPRFPLREFLRGSVGEEALSIPTEILDATSLRQLLEVLLEHAARATHEFDAVFGERA